MSYLVTGAAAVARVDGTDRYYYRGQVIADAPANVNHLVAAGLVEKQDEKQDDKKPVAKS